MVLGEKWPKEEEGSSVRGLLMWTAGQVTCVSVLEGWAPWGGVTPVLNHSWVNWKDKKNMGNHIKNGKNSFPRGRIWSSDCTSSVHLVTPSFVTFFDQKCLCKKRIRSIKQISSPSEKVIIRFYVGNKGWISRKQGDSYTFCVCFFFNWNKLGQSC